MKKTLTMAALWGAIILLGSCSEVSTNPILSIEGGKVQGVYVDSGKTLLYKGIPYAAPPVGDLRFKRPQPVEKWEGVKICDTFGDISWQSPHTDTSSFYTREFYWDGDPQMSEDCLYLNVWTPAYAAAHPEKKLPVAMWIHGGAYMSGWGYEREMDGEAWARKDVILVTINYRLGTLGFFSAPQLAVDYPDGASGNFGTWDQVAALKWIRNNIREFGGDPDKITVFGQSAGATSVKTLVSSPYSRNLIAGAIIQSGGGLSNSPGVSGDKLMKMGEDILEASGIESAEQLRSLPYKELKSRMRGPIREMHATMAMAPSVEGVLLEQSFPDAARDNNISDIPYMIGSNSGDRNGGRSIQQFAALRDSLCG